MQNIFGQNLLNRRKALGLTQEQLAAKLKVSFQAVYIKSTPKLLD